MIFMTTDVCLKSRFSPESAFKGVSLKTSVFLSEHAVKNSLFYRIIDLKLSDTKSHQRKKNTRVIKFFGFHVVSLPSVNICHELQISDLSSASCYGERESWRA